MRVLGRRRLRHRAARTGPAPARGSVLVELPERRATRARSGSRSRPAPLTLPLTEGAPPWAFGADASAPFLAAIDAAPPGPVLDVQQGGDGGGEHALLAAVYSTRLVRALAPDAARGARHPAGGRHQRPAGGGRGAGAGRGGGARARRDARRLRRAHRARAGGAAPGRPARRGGPARRCAPAPRAPPSLGGARRRPRRRRRHRRRCLGTAGGARRPRVRPLGPGVLAPAGSPAAAFELRSRAWRAAFDPAASPTSPMSPTSGTRRTPSAERAPDAAPTHASTARRAPEAGRRRCRGPPRGTRAGRTGRRGARAACARSRRISSKPVHVGERLARPGDVAVDLGLHEGRRHRHGLAEDLQRVRAAPAERVQAGVDDEPRRPEDPRHQRAEQLLVAGVEAHLLREQLRVQPPALRVHGHDAEPLQRGQVGAGSACARAAGGGPARPRGTPPPPGSSRCRRPAGRR